MEVETQVAASPLVERIRASVIGDDEVMDGPYTQADHLCRLHRVGAGAGVHRGLHPGRGPAPLRQHPHRELRHGVADDPAPRGRPADHPRRRRRRRRHPGAVLRVGQHRRGRQAHRHPQPPDPWRPGRPVRAVGRDPAGGAAGGVHRAVRAPLQRAAVAESIADVVVIHEDADGHVDQGQLEEELRRHADRPLRIGSFSAASNVTGIVSDTRAIAALLHRHGALSFWDCAAAGPYVEIDMGAPEDRPDGLQGRDLPLTAQVHRRAGHPWGAGRAPGAAPQPGPDGPGGRDRGLCEPERASLPRRPGRARGGRHPGDRRVDPGRPGVPAQAGGRGRHHPGAGAVLHPPRRRLLGREPQHRAARQPRRRAAVDRVLRGPRRLQLPPPQLRGGAAERPVRHPVAGRLVLAAPTATGCWASTSSGRTSSSGRSPAGARASSPAGSG